MRCHYLSDLQLEREDVSFDLPRGDLLLITGDLCHARCLDPTASRPYNFAQRDRVMRFVDRASQSFRHVVLVAGTHEHHDGRFETTSVLLRRHLPSVTVLVDDRIEIDGVRLFGSTLWTERGRTAHALDAVRRSAGDLFFIQSDDATARRRRFQPEPAFAAHERTRERLSVALADGRATIVVTHHAPSLLELNRAHKGNGLDALYAGDLDAFIAQHSNILAWVHGHMHIARRFQIAATSVYSNADGITTGGRARAGFSPQAHIDVR